MADTTESIAFPGVGLLTECSWEVCNKIGGIYTVLSTKAVELKRMFADRLVFIGPDLGQGLKAQEPSYFIEKKTLLRNFSSARLPHELKVRCGRWDIPGSPLVVLVDFRPMFRHLNEIYGKIWENFNVDSLHAYGDYDESCAFAVASAIVAIELGRHLKVDPASQIAHYNEWTTGMGLLYMKLHQPQTATVFTTHATTVGRSICGNGKPLYQYFQYYSGDQMASELNVESKHSLEKMAAWNADCFTAVSDVTARECAQLLGREPDVVTPNGFEPSFVPSSAKWRRLREQGRKKILDIASLLYGRKLPEDTFIVATSGRNEFRNKGLDLFIDSIRRLADKAAPDASVVALVLVPAWVSQPSGDLLTDMEFCGSISPQPNYLTHRLNNEDSDAIACAIRRVQAESERIGKSVLPVFVPAYLNGNDGIVNISYYDFLPAVDITVFASYYEPWGYTPLESVAFGVPTVTTDKAGFGEWARLNGTDSIFRDGVAVINREDTNYRENVEEISDLLLDYEGNRALWAEAARGAFATAARAEWGLFIRKYGEAFGVALKNASRRQQ